MEMFALLLDISLTMYLRFYVARRSVRDIVETFLQSCQHLWVLHHLVCELFYELERQSYSAAKNPNTNMDLRLVTPPTQEAEQGNATPSRTLEEEHILSQM